jgi:hypothetical protein
MHFLGFCIYNNIHCRHLRELIPVFIAQALSEGFQIKGAIRKGD